MLLWMPPEPGWLGKLVAGQSRDAWRRRMYARRRLIEAGILERDLRCLYTPRMTEAWLNSQVQRLAVKWRKLLRRRKSERSRTV